MRPGGVVDLRLVSGIVLFLLMAGLSVSLPPNVPEAKGAHTAPVILATVPGPVRPFRVAVDKTTNRIYNVSEVGITQVIDGSNNAVMATLPGMPFRGVAANDVTNCVYVVGFGMRVIDYDNTVPYTLSVGGDAVAVDPTRNLIYTTTGGGLAITDGVTHAVTTIPLPAPFGAPGPDVGGYGSIAVNPVTNRVYVGDNDISANLQLAQVIVFNRTTNTTSTIPISVPGAGYAYIGDIDVNPATNRIYVFVQDQYGAATPRVMVFDAATNGFITQILTPVGARGQLAVDTNTNRIHVLGSAASTPGGWPLSVVNGSTNVIDSTLTLPSNIPLSVAANPTTDRVYVTRVDFLDVGNTAVIGEPGSSSLPGPSRTAGRCRQPSNQPPSANAGPDQTKEATSPSGAEVTLNASASSDPDNDTLTFTWKEGSTTLGTGVEIRPTLALGTHTITLTADDGRGGTATDTVVVTVQDTTAPTLTVSLSPNVLSPANHVLGGVTATITVSDAATASPSVILVSIVSSEADAGVGPGDVAGDIQGAMFNTDDRAFSLRAEGYGVSGTRRTYTVTYRATDGAGNATPQTATVTVPNTRPVANATSNSPVECTSTSGGAVSLSGAASSDADGDTLSYSWSGALTGTGAMITGTLARGTHSITLTVNDGFGETATTSVQVTVQDTQAPTLTLAVAPGELWPPDHRLVTETASITTNDICDGAPSVELVSITSNEADSGLGDGDVAGDIQNASFGTDDRAFSLRAERAWTGTGRTYTITYRARDASGNPVTRTATVTVPLGTQVMIDIKPGSFPSSFSCRVTNGEVPVAILGTATFDATTVDANSVRFGKTGIEATEIHRDSAGMAVRHLEDVNGDGRMDLVFHLRFGSTGFSCADIPAGQSSVTLPGRLTGLTTSGAPIRGEDSIRLTGG